MPQYKVNPKIHKFCYEGVNYMSGETCEVPESIAEAIPYILTPIKPVTVVKAPVATVKQPPINASAGTNSAFSVTGATAPLKVQPPLDTAKNEDYESLRKQKKPQA
jgi:hypothetical protein